jgi:hypothetical protein
LRHGEGAYVYSEDITQPNKNGMRNK